MLKGKYVGLRAVNKDDLPQLMEWRNQPHFRQFFREYKEIGETQQEKWYEKFVIQDPATLMFSIVDLETNRLMGACGLCYINSVNRTCDLSIYIGADDLYIDEQYAPDTALTLMKYAFEEVNINKLWAEVYDFDYAKIHFFKQLGFQEEGRHRENYWSGGKWHDSLFFGLLRTEYTKANAHLANNDNAHSAA